MRDEFVLERMAFLMKTWIFVCEDGKVREYGESGELNPLYQSADLRRMLMDGADGQEAPYILLDEFSVFFACIRDEDAYILIGPMATEYMDRAKRHRFYRKVQVQSDIDRSLPLHTAVEVLVFLSTLAKLITGRIWTDDMLAEINHLQLMDRREESRNELRYSLKEEEAMDYRHTYQEERQMLDMIRIGNVEEAVKRSKKLDGDVGRLGTTDLVHWRNMLVIAATLCARAAIDGGVQPYLAYRISGYYINSGMNCRDVHQLLAYKYHATEELAGLVRDLKKKHTSSYVKQCKDYVTKHFREKIYLADIAEQLDVSPSYLSRLFKRETGECLQDYITKVRVERAANLLIYSVEPIPEIAEYVNFPSQSYFGKVFKKFKHMTPRQYRETYKPSEFSE